MTAKSRVSNCPSPALSDDHLGLNPYGPRCASTALLSAVGAFLLGVCALFSMLIIKNDVFCAENVPSIGVTKKYDGDANGDFAKEVALESLQSQGFMRLSKDTKVAKDPSSDTSWTVTGFGMKHNGAVEPVECDLFVTEWDDGTRYEVKEIRVNGHRVYANRRS